MTSYTFTPISYPGATSTIVNGINNAGTMVGSYNDSQGNGHGFIDNGQFTSIDYPNATQTYVSGINNTGEIVGHYIDASGAEHGFTDVGGTFTSIDYPGGTNTSINGVNDLGAVVGSYDNPLNVTQGFLLSQGTFSTITYPNAIATTAAGITNTGVVVGTYTTQPATGITHSAFTEQGGVYTTQNVPNAQATTYFGVNNAGSTVGNTIDAQGQEHGLVVVNGQVTTLDAPNAPISSTYVKGINDQGQVVGFLSGSGMGFVANPDGVSCFATGTTFATARGEVAVEHLVVGDRVVTASGDHRPIRWIGSRAVHCASARDPRAVWPIRIAAHAFGAGQPMRDLLVSPDHAIAVTCVDEVLVPASRLLNGATIARHPVDTITYWHVELDAHDILFANGLRAESYLDVGHRDFFAEAEVVTLHPTLGPAGRDTTGFCRPFVQSGPTLDGVRSRLAARAEALGWTARHQPDLAIVVDGRRLDILRDDGTVVVLLPSAASAVRLVSDGFVPDDGNGGGDRRRLGIALRGLVVLAGSAAPHAIALDDPRLAEGFLATERHDGTPRRWTTGDALLPASLWAGLTGPVALRLDLDISNIRSWREPVTAGARPGSLRRIA